MSLRILLTCWGSYGDLFPYLAVGARLKALGHEPTIATCGFYRDVVERAGLRFHAVRPDVDPTDTALIERVMDPSRGTEVIVRELLVPALRDSFADLGVAARTADLIVGHPVAFAAPLVAESLGVRWLSVVLAPTSLFSVHDFPILSPYTTAVRVARVAPLFAKGVLKLCHMATRAWTSPIRTFRAELGLPDRGDPLFEGQFSPFGTLALFSRVMAVPQPDWPLRTTLTGFAFHDGDGQLPANVVDFLASGDAPIVFTLGSSAVGAPGRFYEESLDAVTRLRRRAVLLVGRRSTVGLQPTSSNVCMAEYAPHAPLFARAAAIVHHGGVGTTAQALRAGCPMLVVPHAHDQPDNAFRVSRLGVAATLPASRYTGRQAAASIAALLSDPRVLSRSAGIARELAAEDGPGAACQAIMAAAEQPEGPT
ncbi:MAG: glycosyltransferase [Vicinamibacterales bacterium]